MTSGRLLTRLGVSVCLVALGTAGAALYLNYMKRQELGRQLASVRATLAERQHAFTELEAQQQQLTRQFDEAQQRQKASEADVAQLTQDREHLSTQLTTLTAERAAAAKELQRADGALAQLRGDMDTLERARNSLQAQKRTLEVAIMARDRKALTQAEIEQVSENLTKQEAENQQLTQRLAALSHDYERLTQERDQLVQGIDAHPPEPGSSWANQLAAWATGLGARESVLAARYKEVGEGYLQIGDYARAAEAFERSLELKPDPELHTRLALIYSRFLHQGDRARQHAAQSPVVPSLQPGDASRTQHMPRSSWQLIRDWLTQ